jgi:hypothetical protein
MAETDSSKNWLKEHWIKILIGFIGVFLVIGLIRGLVALFNGPLGNGIADIFGAASNLVNGLVNGCTSQADCTKPKNRDDCVASNGCSWDTGDTTTTPTTPATCFNSTGRKTGDGSFFSTSCLLGIGFIAYLALILIGPILKGLAYLFGGAKDVVKNTSRLTGESLPETMDKMTENAHKVAERMFDQLEKEGHDINDPKVRKAVARAAAIQSGYNDQVKAAEGSSHVPATEARQMAENASRAREERQTEEEKANSKSMGDGKAEDIRKAAEDASPSERPP